MKVGNRFLRSVASSTGLDGEPLPATPLIEVFGQWRVLIENHHGVVAYGCKEIRVKVRHGAVSICGENLQLKKMSKEQLVITGKICAVNLHGRGEYSDFSQY